MGKSSFYLSYAKVYFGIFTTIFFFLFIIAYIFANGYHAFNLDFILALNYDIADSLLPAIINTVIIVFITLMISVPIGIACAIYLTEYSDPDSKVLKIIRISTESLTAIPSIIYGLFGFIFFVIYLRWSWSILAGAVTLSIMILPITVRSTEESLKSVSLSYREGSYALGADKLRTILRVVLPNAMSGIFVSIMLSVGRIVGETSALVLTAGTVMKIPKSLFSSGATLSVFMFTAAEEGRDFDKVYATAIVLIILVFLFNMFAKFISKRMNRS
jgi:phosphate transport system permease protein